jgi:hypothetical protein
MLAGSYSQGALVAENILRNLPARQAVRVQGSGTVTIGRNAAIAHIFGL